MSSGLESDGSGNESLQALEMPMKIESQKACLRFFLSEGIYLSGCGSVIIIRRCPRWTIFRSKKGRAEM